MGFENIKQEFPKMPQEMRDMIEKEVERQLQAEQPNRKGKKSMRRAVALSLAAVMLCGLTAFAAGIYRMQQEKIGEHGVNVSIAGSEDTPKPADEESIVIPNVKMETGYLPEGMVRTGRGTFSFEDALNQGGVTVTFYRMDTGDDKFEVQHGDVLASEEFTAGGYQGVYLEYPALYTDEITFNQRIYVAYTDVHYVMEMYAASDVSKEEALKIAEHIKLIPTEDTTGDDLVTAQNWSSRQDGAGKDSSGEGCRTMTAVTAEEMKNTHAVGDSFPVNGQGLMAKISDVKVMEDLSLLDAAFTGEDLKEETDETGTLRPATIRYMKMGGLNSLSEEVDSRQVPQKLVYATVEYTNTGDGEMTDVLFFGSLARIREDNGQMRIIAEELPAESDQWEVAVNHGLSDDHDMIYYDMHGGEKGNNYIPDIQPGETVTVHMAWVVTDEELGELYISLDSSGGAYEFTDSSLKIGYVDIRQ